MIAAILKELYGCVKSYVESQEGLFSRKQQEGESLQEYSHALCSLMDKVLQCAPDSVPTLICCCVISSLSICMIQLCVESSIALFARSSSCPCLMFGQKPSDGSRRGGPVSVGGVGVILCPHYVLCIILGPRLRLSLYLQDPLV